MWGFVGKIGTTDTGTDNDTENSVTTGTDNRYFDNPVLVLVIGTFEMATTGTGNRYSNRVLTKGLWKCVCDAKNFI